MGKFYETQAFKKLYAEWDGKLDHLSTPTNPYLYYPQSRASEAKSYNRAEYFYKLAQLVQAKRFHSPRDRLILSARAEGLKIVEIQALLKGQGYSAHRQTIRFIVRRYENKWKLRHWARAQLTSNRAIKSSPTKG